METQTARRNYAAYDFLDGEGTPLPTLAEPVRCSRCGAKLRMTNVNHGRDASGAVCDPCDATLERQRLEAIWQSGTVKLVDGVLMDRTEIAQKKNAAKARQEKSLMASRARWNPTVTYNADLDALKLIVASGGTCTNRALSDLVGCTLSTAKTKMMRLYERYGWVSRDYVELTPTKPAYIYRVTEAGRKAIKGGSHE